MPTVKQERASKRNIEKAQEAWQGMSSRERARAQPEGRGRKKPGTTGKGDYFHIEVRDKEQFTTFRTHDVGEPGGIQRVAGKRSSGSWDDQKWLIGKEQAHIDKGKLIPDTEDARAVLAALDRSLSMSEATVSGPRPGSTYLKRTNLLVRKDRRDSKTYERLKQPGRNKPV